MKCLKEPLSRLADRQDQTRGAFFEGRFKSKAILDEESLLAPVAYIDLNPVEEDAEVAARRIQIRLTGRKTEQARATVQPMSRPAMVEFDPLRTRRRKVTRNVVARISA